jgi:hypothetical protein
MYTWRVLVVAVFVSILLGGCASNAEMRARGAPMAQEPPAEPRSSRQSPTLPSSAIPTSRRALVIGNAAYETAPLRNPVHDATDIATTLRQLGFEVALVHDADRRTMENAIDAFHRQLRLGGIGLFYFAGHGVQLDGENYLLPLKARIERERDLRYEAVPVGRVLVAMEDAGNEVNMIILDACRDNPYARQWRSSQRGLAVVQAISGSLIAFATQPGGVAADGEGRNGLYTTQLLRAMTIPGLSLEAMFKQVRVAVIRATESRQIPWESSSLTGDFFFVPQPILSSADTSHAINLGLVDGSYNVTLDVTNDPSVPNIVGTMTVTGGNISGWRFVVDANIFPGTNISQGVGTCFLAGQTQDQCAFEFGPDNTHPRFFIAVAAGRRNWFYVPVAGAGGRQ